jgi:cell pole-organizing protein PopZ
MKTNYPIISWSTNNADVTPLQSGRSDIHGFSDDYFFNILKNSGSGAILRRDCHLDVPCRAIPYEPAMALVDEVNNILIDVEIDAPYHGWYRFPMHYTEGKDAVRDRYFNDCGWTVVRFTERQVHEQADACVELLRRIVATLKGETEDLDGIVQPEQRWTQKEAVEMEKELFREKLLQIQSFGQPEFLPELREKVAENDSRSCRSVHPDIVFNEASHTYADARNQTGTADYTSVTTLIEKFFPFFDEEAYIEHFMAESGKSREEVVRKMLEPSERGTFMHQQIEYFLKGKPHEEDFKEFQLFLKFHEEQILRRGLEFYDAEKIVTLPQYGIAGTVDALFRKPDGNFVMVDWKRSKNLIIDGYPKKYGTGRGLSILSHLDNSSYYHYELQQSFYKYILETEYGMKVSSMILCVLHPEYDRYYTIKLSDYRVQEVREMVAALISLSIRQ